MKTACTLFLFVLTLPLFSQSTIHGQLIDENAAYLSYATVLLLSPSDSSLVQGGVTDEGGSYTFENVVRGEYILTCNMLGYEPVYKRISVLEPIVEQGTAQLKPSTAQLKTVEVSARRPLFEQKLDRMVVNVSQSISSAGGTALEILEKSPGVIVNRQNNTVSMSGKEGVVVMVNGKISRMPASALLQMLSGMPASSIEKIELISTPPASFDAEGNAGYINIILKRNLGDGFNGSSTLTAGYGKAEKYGGNINLNYRAGRLGIFADYGFSFDRTPQIFRNFRSIRTSTATVNTRTRSLRNTTQTNHNYRVGIDYRITDRTSLGAIVSGYDNRWEMNAFNVAQIARNGTLDTLLTINNNETNYWKHYMGNLSLTHNFDEQTKLTLNADYLYYLDNNPTHYENHFNDAESELLYEEQVQVGKRTPIHIAVGKADFSRSWGESLSWEAGLKGIRSIFDNDVSVSTLFPNGWVFDRELTQKYDLQEFIGAAYSSFKFKIGEKDNLSFGLRYEYTDSYLSSEAEEGLVDREYGNWFPSFYWSRSIDERQNFQFSYSRRIRRPTFNDMAPFVIFTDPFTFFSGNPALQPSITDVLKAVYQYRTYFFSLQYSYDDEAIAAFQPTIDPETNRQIIAAENLDYSQTLNLSISLPFALTEWWEMQNNVSATWQQNQIREEEQPIVLDQRSVNISTSQLFTLPHEFLFEVSGFYSSPVLFGITKTDAFGALNFGLQKEVFGGKLQLSLQDVFQTNIWASSVDQPEAGIYLDMYLRFRNRTLRLTYNYNFGNQKVKVDRQRETGSETERQRVN